MDSRGVVSVGETNQAVGVSSRDIFKLCKAKRRGDGAQA